MQVRIVHGFGGRSYDHALADAMRDHARKLRFSLPIETFAWESGVLDFKFTGREWTEAKEKVKTAAAELARLLAESSDTLYLVGFSLGARVVLDAAESLAAQKRPITGIFLLGAAESHNRPVAALAGRVREGIINYYSPEEDEVLGTVYRAQEGTPAAGSQGFTDGQQAGTSVYNFRVAQSHVLSDGYACTAQAVAELIAFQQGIEVPGELSLNLALPTAGGQRYWHDIVRRGPLLVQRGPTSLPHYRLINLADSNRRMAWGDTLAPVLREMDRLGGGASYVST